MQAVYVFHIPMPERDTLMRLRSHGYNSRLDRYESRRDSDRLSSGEEGFL